MPWTLRVFPAALVPRPKVETAHVPTFAVPVTFAEEATTFVVVMPFETYTLPWTLRAFPAALVPRPKVEAAHVWTFIVPVMFAEEATTFVVVTLFEA